MLLTIEHAKKVRRKRGELQLGKVQLAKKLKITPPTLAKIEAGNYDAPKRIYESVIEWLLEDYQKGANQSLFQFIFTDFLYGTLALKIDLSDQLAIRQIKMLATYGSIKDL